MRQPWRTLFGLPALVACGGLFTACQEPCQALAERICTCAPDLGARQGCRQERILAQRTLVPTPEEQDICVAALETCTCVALDENRFDLCGFTRAGGASLPTNPAAATLNGADAGSAELSTANASAANPAPPDGGS